MRSRWSFAAVALVVVAGVHCGPGDRAPPGASEQDQVGDQDGPSQSGGPGTRATDPSPEDGDAPDRAALLEPDGQRSAVAAEGPEGERYVVGLFAGTIDFGEETLRSHGRDDVYLVRYEADGRVAWARGMGGRFDESAPSVTYSERKIRVIATTGGEVDCGLGPTGIWSSPMFLFCQFDAAGTRLGGGTFPTGAPY